MQSHPILLTQACVCLRPFEVFFFSHNQRIAHHLLEISLNRILGSLSSFFLDGPINFKADLNMNIKGISANPG